MKITETKRNHIDEGPLDLLTKSGRAQRKSFKQGGQVVDQATKQLTNQFARYLGTEGKTNMKQATTQDVIEFLKTKSVDTSDIDVNKPMDTKRIKAIFTQKVRDTAQGRGEPKKSTPAVNQKTQQKQSQKPSPKAKSVYMNVKDKIGQLNMRDKKRVLAALQKDIDAKKKTQPEFKSQRN